MAKTKYGADLAEQLADNFVQEGEDRASLGMPYEVHKQNLETNIGETDPEPLPPSYEASLFLESDGDIAKAYRDDQYNTARINGQAENLGVLTRVLGWANSAISSGKWAVQEGAALKDIETGLEPDTDPGQGVSSPEIDRIREERSTRMDNPATGYGKYGMPEWMDAPFNFLQQNVAQPLHSMFPTWNAERVVRSAKDLAKNGDAESATRMLQSVVRTAPGGELITFAESDIIQNYIQAGVDPSKHMGIISSQAILMSVTDLALTSIGMKPLATVAKAGKALSKTTIGRIMSPVTGDYLVNQPSFKPLFAKFLGQMAVQTPARVAGEVTDDVQMIFSANYSGAVDRGMSAGQAVMHALRATTSESAGKQMLETGLVTLQAQLGGGWLVPAVGGVFSARDVMSAKKNEAAFSNMVKVVEKSGDPKSARLLGMVVSNKLKNTHMATTKIGANRLVASLEKAGVDFSDAAKQMGIDESALDAALASDSEIEIDTGSFLSTLVSSGVAKEVLKDVKFGNQLHTSRMVALINQSITKRSVEIEKAKNPEAKQPAPPVAAEEEAPSVLKPVEEVDEFGPEDSEVATLLSGATEQEKLEADAIADTIVGPPPVATTAAALKPRGSTAKTVGPETLSVKEAAASASDTEGLDELGKEYEARGSARSVLNRVKAVVDETGMPREFAKKQTRLIAKVYESVASDMGISADKLFDLIPLTHVVVDVGQDLSGDAANKARGEFKLNQSIRGATSIERAGGIGIYTTGTGEYAPAGAEAHVHEIGHFATKLLIMSASLPNASANVRGMVSTLLTELGVDTTPGLVDRSDAFSAALANLTPQQHETLANWWTEYMKSGNAPTEELQSTFNYIASMVIRALASLVGIRAKASINMTIQQTYDIQGIAGLVKEGKMPPAVIVAIFDKLIVPAYDRGNIGVQNGNVVDATRRELALNPMADTGNIDLSAVKPLDPSQYEEVLFSKVPTEEDALIAAMDAIGIPEEQRAEYAKLIEDDRAMARAETANKIAKKDTAPWRARLAANKKRAELEVNGDQQMVSAQLLRTGKLPDGLTVPSELPTGMKISEEAVLAMDNGAMLLIRLNKNGKVTSKSNGMDPAGLAAILQYDSAEEMIADLEKAPTTKEWVAKRAYDKTVEQLGEPVTPQDAVNAAVGGLHNEARGKRLRFEFNHLLKNAPEGARMAMKAIALRVRPSAEMKAAALRNVANAEIGTIKPAAILRAERAAAVASSRALLNGKWELAAEEKAKEIEAHELYRAAIAQKDRLEQLIDIGNSTKKPTAMQKYAKAGMDLAEQMQAALVRFGFQKPTQMSEAAMPLDDFIAAMENDPGITLEVGAELARFLKEGGAITGAIVDQAIDYLSKLRHIASAETKIIHEGKSIDRADAIADMDAAAAEHLTKDPEANARNQSKFREMTSGLRAYGAMHLKMEPVFKWLDNNVFNGRWWKTLYEPFYNAERVEADLSAAHAAVLTEAFSVYTKKEMADIHGKKSYRVDSVNESFSKEQLISILLNTGNQYNRDALLEGFGWSEEQLADVLSNLDERDIQTAQKILDLIGSHWEEISKMHRRITGKTPKRVAALASVVNGVEFRGGYYPVAMDKGLSFLPDKADEASSVEDLWAQSSTSAMTAHGHLKQRSGTGGRPLSLKLSVATEHLAAVAHDLAFREAVIDAWKLVNDKAFREMFISYAGRETYNRLNPWLKNIARQAPTDPTDVLTWILNKFKGGASLAYLGFNAGTALTQSTGMALSVKELGAQYMGIGMKEVFKHGLSMEAYRFATENSQLMRDRLSEGYDQHSRALLRKSGIIDDAGNMLINVPGMTKDIQATFMKFIGYGQMMVDLPTWHGAYQKALEGKAGGTELGNHDLAVSYADQVVRLTQGSTAAKDLSGVQALRGAISIFTQFYHFFAVSVNQMVSTARGAGYAGGKGVGALAIGMLLLMVPGIMDDVIRGRSSDDDDPWKYLTRLIKYPFAGLIGGRDLADSIERTITTGNVGFRNATIDAMAQFSGLIALPIKAAIGQDIKEKDVKSAVLGAAVATGTPGLQAWRVMHGIYDIAQGKAANSSGLNIARSVILGTKLEDNR